MIWLDILIGLGLLVTWVVAYAIGYSAGYIAAQAKRRMNKEPT